MVYGSWTTERIEAAIKEISEVMKGPMSNLERHVSYLDRKELRAELERRATCQTDKGANHVS